MNCEPVAPRETGLARIAHNTHRVLVYTPSLIGKAFSRFLSIDTRLVAGCMAKATIRRTSTGKEAHSSQQRS